MLGFYYPQGVIVWVARKSTIPFNEHLVGKILFNSLYLGNYLLLVRALNGLLAQPDLFL
jgi:hypothetical protein